MFNENVFPLFPLSTGENKQVDNRNSPPIKFLPNHHIIIYIYISAISFDRAKRRMDRKREREEETKRQ